MLPSQQEAPGFQSAFSSGFSDIVTADKCNQVIKKPGRLVNYTEIRHQNGPEWARMGQNGPCPIHISEDCVERESSFPGNPKLGESLLVCQCDRPRDGKAVQGDTNSTKKYTKTGKFILLNWMIRKKTVSWLYFMRCMKTVQIEQKTNKQTNICCVFQISERSDYVFLWWKWNPSDQSHHHQL